MKLAFVDNLPVGGGLSRFSYLLCKSLIELDPNLQIDYFAHHDNLQRTPELYGIGDRVKIVPLEASRPRGLYSRVMHKAGTLLNLPAKRSNAVRDEIEAKVTDYDLAYFPSAHMMEKPKLRIPVTGTIHDFNWKYFFGREIFSPAFVAKMNEAMPAWLNECETICSSHFVAEEARKLYPGMKGYPEVVHIAPVVFTRDMQAINEADILKQYKINYPYIIFPGNFYPHKNHLNLFSAFSLLSGREAFKDYKLLLTGMHTDQVAYGTAEKFGIRLVPEKKDGHKFNVRGLGYLPNNVIDILIKNAKLLVSPSLYEAICTPGMDAWHFGTPTAISNIPPFTEHEQVWGIKSRYFDPMDPVNIADTIADYLSNEKQAREDGQVSKTNIYKYNWTAVAKGYMDVFQRAISKSMS